MTMLEKMARAIAAAQVEKIGGPIQDPNDPGDIECAAILARAALDAIREPSVDATYSGQNCSPDHDSDYGSDDSEYRYLSSKGAGEVFTTMIDHILGGGE